jgi:hypothetical protein
MDPRNFAQKPEALNRELPEVNTLVDFGDWGAGTAPVLGIKSLKNLQQTTYSTKNTL